MRGLENNNQDEKTTLKKLVGLKESIIDLEQQKNTIFAAIKTIQKDKSPFLGVSFLLRTPKCITEIQEIFGQIIKRLDHVFLETTVEERPPRLLMQKKISVTFPNNVTRIITGEAEIIKCKKILENSLSYRGGTNPFNPKNRVKYLSDNITTETFKKLRIKTTSDQALRIILTDLDLLSVKRALNDPKNTIENVFKATNMTWS